MARKREVLPPATPLLCDHLTWQNKHYCYGALMLPRHVFSVVIVTLALCTQHVVFFFHEAPCILCTWMQHGGLCRFWCGRYVGRVSTSAVSNKWSVCDSVAWVSASERAKCHPVSDDVEGRKQYSIVGGMAKLKCAAYVIWSLFST